MEIKQPKNSGIFGAFVKFQGAVGKIGRSTGGQVGNQTYKYAPLEVIIAAIRTPLAENGLAYIQDINGATVTTRIIHSSGEEIQHTADFPEWAIADDKGRGSAMQRAGILHTYMRRYALLAALGLSPEDEDTDAQVVKTAANSGMRSKDDPEWKGPLNKTALKKAAHEVNTNIQAAADQDALDNYGRSKECMVIVEQLSKDMPKWYDRYAEALQKRSDQFRQEFPGDMEATE